MTKCFTMLFFPLVKRCYRSLYKLEFSLKHVLSFFLLKPAIWLMKQHVFLNVVNTFRFFYYFHPLVKIVVIHINNINYPYSRMIFKKTKLVKIIILKELRTLTWAIFKKRQKVNGNLSRNIQYLNINMSTRNAIDETSIDRLSPSYNSQKTS